MVDQPQDQAPIQQQESPQEQQAPQPQPDQSEFRLEDALSEYADKLNLADAPSNSDSEPQSDKPEAEYEAAPKEDDKPAEPPDSKWAAIRRREQQLTQTKEEFARQREAFLVERKQHEAELIQLQEWNKLKGRSKHDVEAAAKALGFSDLKELLERVAESGGKMTPEQARLYELEQQLDAEKTAREEARKEIETRTQQEQIQQNTQKWHQSIEKYIQDTPEFKDSLAGIKDVAPAVFQAMQAHYTEHEEQLPYDQAVKQVSEQLETRITGMLDELVSNKRGLEIFTNLASKLNKPAPASKNAQAGITQRISNSTGVKRTKPPRFDEALDEAASWLSSQPG